MANKIVQLHDEANNNIYPVTTIDAIHGSGALRADFVLKAGDTMTGPLTATRFIGNADSATKLQTARTLTIGKTGKTFNGSSNVSWTLSEIAAGQTISNNAFGAITLERNDSANAASIIFKNTNGVLGSIGMTQTANGGLVRWTPDTSNAYTLLDTGNYTNYTVNKTGSGASGTWGINVTGTAGALTTNAGSSTRPVYFSGGKPVQCGTSLGVNITGSSASCTGNAATATTATQLPYCSVNGGNTYNYPYHRILYRTTMTGTYLDTSDIFLISHNFDGGGFGIIKISYRTNDTNAATSFNAQWLVRHNISESSIIIASYGVTGNCYADVFYYTPSGWPRCTITRLAGNKDWTMVNSQEADNTTTSDPKTSYEAYASIAAAGTALHGKAYTATKNSVQIPIYGAVWN